MKKRSIIQMSILAGAIAVLGLFQNCAKVSATDTGDQKLSATGEPIATATDDNNQPVPVEVQPATEVVSTPTPTPAPSPDEPSPTAPEDPAIEPVELQKNCGLELETIHNVIDVDQFGDQAVHLDVIRGKTLVYSSSGEFHLSSLTIGTASGRTILCGIVVDELAVHKGRLDVMNSVVKKITSNSNNIRADSSSTLPAGF